MLVQMPVFFALYWTLAQSVELRQAPFILWMQDLFRSRPVLHLPVLYGISMWVQQRCPASRRRWTRPKRR